MPRKPPDDFYRYDLIKLYVNGASLIALSRLTGADYATVKKHLLKKGIKLRTKTEDMTARWAKKLTHKTWEPRSNVIRRYKRGESAESIAANEGVNANWLRAYLRYRGIKIRTTSAANTAWYITHSTEERIKRSNHGKYDTANIKRARTHQRTKSRVGRGELELIKLIYKIRPGSNICQQDPVGPYNIDFTIDHSIAVEVERGGGHPFHLKNFERRLKYLLNRGWFVIFVYAPPKTPITQACAKKIISYLDRSKRNLAQGGKYRVIRGTGEDAPTSGFNRHKRAIIPPSV